MKVCPAIASSGFKLLVVAALLLGFVVALPGCGGCTGNNPTAAAKKKKADEEEATKKKKKKKAEKPKPNFEPIQVRMLPSNDPTLSDKTPRMYIKPGHWVALSATTKANNFDFPGDLVTYAEAKGTNPPQPLEIENTNSRLSVWRPASLPKGRTMPFETLLFVPKRPSVAGSVFSLRSELRGQRGGALQEPANNLANAMQQYEFVIVVLSSNPAAYTHLDKLNSVRMPEVEANPDQTLQYYYVLRPNCEKRVPLPSHSLALTTTAYIVWDDINPAVLTAEQQQALVDWIYWGGQLIVSGPGSLDKLKGTFLGPHLPAESAETVKLDESAFDEMNCVWSLVAEKKKSGLRTIKIGEDRPMVGVRFKKHVAAVDVMGTGGLVVERRVGGGRIVATAFPLTDVRIKQWKNFDGFFNSALLRRPSREFASHSQWATLDVHWAATGLRHMLLEPRLGSTLRYFTRDIGYLAEDPRAVTALEPGPVAPEIMPGMPGMAGGAAGMGGMGTGRLGYIPYEQHRPDTTGFHPPSEDWHFGGYIAAPQTGVAAWNDDGAASKAARQALTEAAGIEIPRADFVLKVLAIYLAILVPLNWMVFRVLGRVEWAWVAAPVIAVVGAVAVIRLAQLDIGFARSRTEIAVLEVQGGYDRAHLTRYTALYTSLSSSYELAFSEPNALALPFASPPEEVAQQQIAAINDVLFRRDRDTTLSGVKVQSNSTGMVHSEQMFPLEGMLTLIGDDQKGWTIKNTSSLTIRDAGLLRKTATGQVQTAYLAQLEPRTSSPLSFSPAPQVRVQIGPSEEKKFELRDAFWLPEWDQSPVLQAATKDAPEQRGQVRLTRLARLATERLSLLPGDVRLVGWTDELLAGIQISPHAPQNKTYTLVLAHLVRGKLPAATPDANVAEDFFEPPLDDDLLPDAIETETTQTDAPVPAGF
ncbi:MAG: hypothetical protein WD872_04035 [Pirellulaceae bacterium]